MTDVYPPHGHGIPGHGGRRVAEPRNGLGLAALIVGIVALLGAIIPFVNLTAWIPGLVGVGLALGALGRVRRRQANNKVQSIIGLVLSGAAVALSLTTIANVINAADEAFGPSTVTPADGSSGQQQAEQVVFNVGEAADVEGLQISVTALEQRKPRFGDPMMCAKTTLVNNDDENRSYNGGFDWKLQTPEGHVVSSTVGTATEKDGMASGELIPGASLNAAVCFDAPAAKGQYTVIYEPTSFNSTHVEWKVSR